MKPSLYLCLKNPFSARDFERMGVAALSAYFDVRILDCTNWLMPVAARTRTTDLFDVLGLQRISSLGQFKMALSDAGYAIDYVGQFSPQAILMFEALRQRDIKLVVIDSGAFPMPDITIGSHGLARKLWDAIRQGGLRTHILSMVNRVLLHFLPDQRPDLALVSGNAWRKDPRFALARKQVHAHSFDYERFRVVKQGSPPEEIKDLFGYAVYLDEDLAEHEDNEELGFTTPIKAQRFYPEINTLFDYFEKKTGLKVVIAGYPSRKAGVANRFNGRRVVFGLTAELIRGSSLVFAHASTAISYAVLWRRPLIFLTSDVIAASWYGPWIKAPSHLLEAPLVNLESRVDLPVTLCINETAYSFYEHTFIKAAESPERSLWDTFIQSVQHMQFERP